MLTIVRIVSCTTPILLDLGLLIIFLLQQGALCVTRFNDVAPDLLTAVVFFDINALQFRRKARQQVDPSSGR